MSLAHWRTKSLSENRRGLSQFCAVHGEKRDCPPLPDGSRIGTNGPLPATHRGGWSLAVLVAAVAIVWLAVLPLVGRQPAVRASIDRNERLGIDPAAKFYTELPCMPAVYHRVERALERERP